jgi:TetR/AcrR family transcriptional repressor of bet genes
MPRQVDHDERRRHIVEALLHIAGTRGLDAVSLREVAQQAGVSMGAVQHYFASKEEMLQYALRHWLTLSVHKGFSDRVRRRLGSDTGPAAIALAVAAEYLPYDEPSRFDARVGVAFLARGAVDPALAEALGPAARGLADTLAALLGDAYQGQRLAALLDGLQKPVLLDALSHDDALAVVRRHLADVLG